MTNHEKLNDPDLKDVEPGSDADAMPTPPVGKTPPNVNDRSEGVSPPNRGDGDQQDDNIDDQGNKAGGGTLDQPT